MVHFVGHYFHYDSKFWQTLKLLFSEPGKLTLAYWNKQRNRYLQPISLYIFLSIVFFLTATMGPNTHVSGSTSSNDSSVAAENIAVADSMENAPIVLGRKFREAGRSLTTDDEASEKFLNKLGKAVPKIFFFMIPVLAWILQFVFARRKDLSFVHHAVFALHYHAFWFAGMIVLNIIDLIPHPDIINLVLLILFVTFAAIYFSLALRRVYKSGWLKAILITLFAGISYVVCIVTVFLIVIAFLVQ